jgi:hypothetical protein
MQQRVLGQQDWRVWARHPSVRGAGGLVHPGTLSPFDRALCGWVRSLFREAVIESKRHDYADRFANVSLVFAGSSALNAKALETRTRRAIVFNLGLIRKVWGILRIAVAHSRLHRTVFKSRALRWSGFDPRSEESWARYYRLDGLPDQRADYLFQLFMYVAEFVVHHELAHHARGHMDLVRETLGLEEIDEVHFAAGGLDLPGRRLMQLIEFDADHEALDILLTTQVAEGMRGWGEQALLEDAYRLMLTTILLFQALDLACAPLPAPFTTSHPAPVFRAMRITYTVAVTFPEVFGLPAQDLLALHDEAWADAALVARRIGLPSGRWWGGDGPAALLPELHALEEAFFPFSEALAKRNATEVGARSPEPKRGADATATSDDIDRGPAPKPLI